MRKNTEDFIFYMDKENIGTLNNEICGNFYLKKDKPLKASIEMTSNIISSFISLEILKFFMLDNNRYNFV